MDTPSQPVGQVLGHYRILERIGAGGMGVVYRAHDERLDRDVALKVLPRNSLADESARKRFRKEALTLSKLNHANIAQVYDFDTQDGIDFLVMEYVVGVTLAGKLANQPLPEKQVLVLGEQIAKTLEEAHEHGIVHRDLKPGNIMVTPKEQVKLLDFGLAKLLRVADVDVTASLTDTGDAAGTLPYMAPEQLRGEPADVRTDIYALGTVLYEMITSRRPFEAKLSTTLTDEILHKAPSPPGRLNPALSPKLEDIILKCLEKEPENRYQSAKELAVDLRRLANPTATAKVPVRAKRSRVLLFAVSVGAVIAVILGLNISWLRQNLLRQPSAGTIHSLAVLPFENLSHDPQQEYFADGMSDALTTQIAQIGELRVISRTSAMQFKDAKKPLPQIARELNVDAIIEGSVLRLGNKVRVTAQLIQAFPEQHLWAKSYESDLLDVLSLQSQVARSVADQIRIKLTSEEEARLRKPPHPVDPEAQDAYLRGRFYWNNGEAEDLTKARDYFQQAIEKDPMYALPYAGLADYYSILPFYTSALPDEVFPKAKAAISKALELDDSLAEAHASLAYILTYYDWNWAEAEREFQRSLTLNPNDATVHHRYSRYLSSLGRIDEALNEIRKAQELDPLSPVIRANVGVIYYFGRQYDLAIAQLRKVLEEHPNFSVAHWGLGLVYEQKGMLSEAIAELEKADALGKHGSTNTIASLGHAYAIAGQRSKAEQILSQMNVRSKQEPISSYQFALVFAGLGEKDQALAALEKTFREKSTLLTYVNMDARFDPLRHDPRFTDLLHRMGLPQ
jgi:serine/threonine protein kinase/tetratricopeptide (TPR) repeat protein